MAVLPAGSAEMHPGGVVVGDYDPVNAFPLAGFKQVFHPDQAIL